MPHAKIRVAIADDHRLFTEGLRLILAQEEGMEVVGCAANGLATIEMASELKPDVLLLDITMPVMDGIGALPAIRERSPGTKALMLTGLQSETKVLEALRMGARGYLTKNTSISSLIKAIRAVHDGEMWLERKLITRIFEEGIQGDCDPQENPQSNSHSVLTKREQEVLRFLTKGISNKEIADALFITEKTVKSHLNSIFKKLNVTRRLQAILHAIKAGIC